MSIFQSKILLFEANHVNKKRETHSQGLQKVLWGHHRANAGSMVFSSQYNFAAWGNM